MKTLFQQAVDAVYEGRSKAYPVASWFAKGNRRRAEKMVRNRAMERYDDQMRLAAWPAGAEEHVCYKILLGMK